MAYNEVMEVIAEYDACQDCLLYVVNGDLPEDAEDAARVEDGCNLPHLVIGSDDETGECDLGFSWSRCELCGGLAGDRFRVCQLEPVSTLGVECDTCFEPWNPDCRIPGTELYM